MKYRQSLLYGVAVLSLGYIGWRGYLYLRGPEPLPQVANRAYEAILNNEPNELYALIMPHELEKTGMTRSQCHQFVQWIRDCYRVGKSGGTRKDSPLSEGMGEGAALLGNLEFPSPDGAVQTMTIPLYRTPDGPKLYTIHLVTGALKAKYASSIAKDEGPAGEYRVMRMGLEQEIARLKTYARGVVQSVPENPAFMSWDELLAKSKSWETMAAATPK